MPSTESLNIRGQTDLKSLELRRQTSRTCLDSALGHQEAKGGLVSPSLDGVYQRTAETVRVGSKHHRNAAVGCGREDSRMDSQLEHIGSV